MKTIFTSSDCLSLHQLQSYQKGKLSKLARRKVEEHLIDCPLCNGALEGIEQSQDPAQDAKMIRSLSFQRRKAFRLYPIAATIAIGIIILIALWLRPLPDAQSLFATFYQAPQPTNIQLRGTRETAAEKALQPALVAYQNKDFQSAIIILEKHIKNFPQDNQAYLWMGIAHLEEGKGQQAIQFFQELRIKDKNYYDQASWYLLLTYLKEGKQKLAQEIANDLAQSGGQEFEKELKQLQKKLKRLSE